ncbi:MAG: DUF3293 domain-containing protein [Proteobacteria bacterium]|nr:DUF3293 domain-containing protein [Pseudomonadota bacterium]
MTKIDLEAAYRETRYSIFIDGIEYAVGVEGTVPDEVDNLLHHSKSKTGVILTAWNPRSEVLLSEENQKRNHALLSSLNVKGYEVYEALGRGSDPTWQAEESFFVLGLDDNAAHALAVEYGQNAYVSVHKGGPVLLVFSSTWDDGSSDQG